MVPHTNCSDRRAAFALGPDWNWEQNKMEACETSGWLNKTMKHLLVFVIFWFKLQPWKSICAARDVLTLNRYNWWCYYRARHYLVHNNTQMLLKLHSSAKVLIFKWKAALICFYSLYSMPENCQIKKDSQSKVTVLHWMTQLAFCITEMHTTVVICQRWSTAHIYAWQIVLESPAPYKPGLPYNIFRT